MTNEEITVKYDTSIKNTDAADRTWGPGDAGPVQRGWAGGERGNWGLVPALQEKWEKGLGQGLGPSLR